MKVIALCTNVPELDAGGFRYPDICKKYRGAEWIPYFVELAAKSNKTVLSGSQAIQQADPTLTQVICEEENPVAMELISMGAEPSLLYCMESPLFTPFFYDHLPELKKHFRRQMLFSGGTNHMYFPSYDQETLRLNTIPTRVRKQYVAICSNKHYSSLPYQFQSSPSFQEALKHQLHDLRYKTFFDMKTRNCLDLYGKGWREDVALPVEDKIETMRSYQFALCFENTALPGYITEKIIDCFVAGVIPRYEGAPDINQYIPTAIHLNPGQAFDWLHTPEGQKYSFQGFAKNLLDLLS